MELDDILSEVLKKNKRNFISFLTGAGVSAESGIPTYRGSDGIWVKGTTFHKPEEFGTFKYFSKHPEEVWQFALFRRGMFADAQPNRGHAALVALEQKLKERFYLITQNIDELHFRAGNSQEHGFEIHGNLRKMRCSIGCEDTLYDIPIARKDLADSLTFDEIKSLKCPHCQNWCRPNILWFDETYNERLFKLHSTLSVAKNSGVLIVVGTSGATNLPQMAVANTLKYGGYVIDANLEDNNFTTLLKGKKRALSLRGNSSELLEMIAEKVETFLSK